MTLLGDLGAEIIKIEDPSVRGDEARRVPPQAEDDDSLYYQALNRNSKAITLNLRTPEGQALLHRLVAVSDAVYSNLRGDQPEKLGLTYKALKDVNPRIVCCSLSGYGRTGPRAAEPAYDFLLQAYAGYMSVTGEPDAPPVRCGISIVDFSGGLLSAAALMVGLYRAQKTGLGCDLDLSLMDTAFSTLSYFAIWALNTGYKPRRTNDSAHATLVPSQNFPTKDGWIVVMAMKEKFWQRLCDLLEHPELKEDPRFRTIPDRLKHREELIPVLKGIFQTKTTETWLSILRGQVPCAPVNTIEQALKDPQILARDMIVELEHPRWGRLKQVACPVKVEGATSVYRPAAALGGSNSEVYKGVLHLGDRDLEQLRASGAI
jgi:crotonobetainyl-CoA:carnitine CoA-transferase CaiB-like acyl-CoA transferase